MTCVSQTQRADASLCYLVFIKSYAALLANPLNFMDQEHVELFDFFAGNNKKEPVSSANNKKDVRLEQYRKILGDYSSSDECIQDRLDYIKGLCRNIIRIQLESYAERI